MEVFKLGNALQKMMVSWENYHAYGALKLENQSINEGLCIGQGFFVEGGTPQKWNICRIYFWWINHD
jgi:hypothetical protein